MSSGANTLHPRELDPSRSQMAALELEVAALSPDGLTAQQQLEKLRRSIVPLVERQIKCLCEDVLPKLKAAGIEVASYDSLTKYEKHSLEEYFIEKVNLHEFG